MFRYGSREALEQGDRVSRGYPFGANGLLRGHNRNVPTIGAQPTASTNHFQQQPNAGTAGGSSAVPNRYPAAGAYVHPPSTQDPRTHTPGAYPAPGHDAYGRYTANANMGLGAPATPRDVEIYGQMLARDPSYVPDMYPHPTARLPSGNPVNNAAAPPSTQGEASDPRGSTQASQLSSARATIGSNGIPRKAPAQAQATTGAARAAASSLTTTSQGQSVTASAGPSVSSLHTNPQAVSTSAAVGGGVSSVPATSQVQSTAVPAGVGVLPRQITADIVSSPVTSGGVSSLPTTSQARFTSTAGVGDDVFAIPARSQTRPTTSSAGAGRSSRFSTSEPQSTTTSAGAGLSSVPQVVSPLTAVGSGVAPLPATSEAQFTTASAGAGARSRAAVTQPVSTTSTGSHGVPSLPIVTQPVSTSGAGSGGVSSVRVSHTLLPTGGMAASRPRPKHGASDHSDGPSKKKRKNGGT
jgi:hypothetical protein